MRVTTSCSGRFHIFDQAAELHRHHALHRFINDYPKNQTRRWKLPNDKVDSLLLNGILARLSRHTSTVFSTSLQIQFMEFIHGFFSSRLSKKIPKDSDVFIGLSSFCLEAILEAKSRGIVAIVDHGSLHQRYERRMLEEECEFFGLPMAEQVAPDWLIEKEDREFEAADKVMVLSQAAKRSMEFEGIAAEKLFVNPCGVDILTFRASPKRDKVFRIIFCGALSPRKGIYYLLQAFKMLNIPNAELWLVGSHADAAFYRKLAPLVTDQVKVLGTFPQTHLPHLYSQASVFVLPSIADGFGMVVPQAMACGLPVLVTENVGAADIVKDGCNGFIVPIRNSEALAEKISRLYLDESLHAYMSGESMRRAHADLGWNAYGLRLMAFLKNVMRELVPCEHGP